MDEVRTRLEELMAARGDDYLSISRMLKRNAAYMQQFMKRGVPRKLKEDDRRILATYFGVDEAELGGPVPPAAATVAVPRLRLGASAGAGAHADKEEREGQIVFETKWLKKLASSPRALSIIQVSGESMSPELENGDDIMVDRSDAADRLRDGIYVIRMDDQLMVKRVLLRPGQKLSVISVNKAHQSWPDISPDKVAIIGRVVWTGRKID